MADSNSRGRREGRTRRGRGINYYTVARALKAGEQSGVFEGGRGKKM